MQWKYRWKKIVCRMPDDLRISFENPTSAEVKKLTFHDISNRCRIGEDFQNVFGRFARIHLGGNGHMDIATDNQTVRGKELLHRQRCTVDDSLTGLIVVRILENKI